MNDNLKTLYNSGWSQDRLALLLTTSRPRIKKILNGEESLKTLEQRLVDSVAEKSPRYWVFQKRAIDREIVRFINEELS